MGQARQPNAPSPQSSSSSTAHAGVRVGDYELGDVIGDRGTGTVYCARHVPSDKQVAIKILHSRRQDVVDGLVRGAKAVSRVHHPNLVDITDVGATRDGTVYLAMELLTGESLQDRLHRVGPLPLFEAINVVRQVAHGLGAAHAADVVHGGLEPAKIFLCRRDGRRRVVRRHNATDSKLVVEPEGKFDLVKVLDLGLKRFLDLASYQADLRETARYWSPEQAQRRPVDVRSDVYSLGAVFYEMITGTVPFDGASLAEVLRQHVSGLVTAPSQRSPGVAIDALVDTVILRCLQKTPALRFASTDELCDALDACVTDCAFLRDAHRLPGIEESGIALPEARTKPKRAPEKAEEPAAQVPPPHSRKTETSAGHLVPSPAGLKSPATPKPQAAPPAPGVARSTTLSPTRSLQPARATQSTRTVLEQPPVRTVPSLPPPAPSAASRRAPPMPAAVARTAPVAKSVAPMVPVAHVAPPALPRTATPPELIPTVDESALTEIVTPPPIALSSDLLTEIADVPALAGTGATTNGATPEVSAEANLPVEPEAPVSRVSAQPAEPGSGQTTEPQSTVSPTEASPAIPEPVKLAEAEAASPDAPKAPLEATAPVEPPPSLGQAPSSAPESVERAEPKVPVSPPAEQEAHAEAARQEAPGTPDSDGLNRGDRVDGSDDGQDELLAATWETWRRPKVMVLAGVAVLGAIAVAVWTNRGRPASPTSAGQAVAKAPPPPVAPAPAPVLEQPAAPAQAGMPPTPTPASGTPPMLAVAEETPPTPLLPPAPTPASGTPPLLAAAEETPPTPLLPAAPVPAPVAAEAQRLPDKPPEPAIADQPIAPAAAPAEAMRPSEATPQSPVAAATSEPKPAAPKPRAVPTAGKPVMPSTRDVASATEAPAAPKPAPAAPANLPPRLAVAWANAARPATAPSAPPPAVRPATKSSEQSKVGGSKAIAQPAPASADQLVRQAQQAWLAGQHALALSRAQAALGASPKPGLAVQAYEIVATCSCALRKRDPALEAASHLDTARRESVKAVCAKHGVPFE